MFESDMIFYAVLGLGACAVGAIIFTVLDYWTSGERKAEIRKDLVAGGKKINVTAKEGMLEQTRRREVEDALSEIEEKTKKKKKISMRLRLQQAGYDSVKPRTFYLLSLIPALIVTGLMLVFGLPLLFAPAGLLIGGIGIPRFILGKLTQRRQKKFMSEFITAIDIIVRGVKAGLPFNDCMTIITKEVGEPVKSEFLQVVEQQKVGVPVDQALNKLYERIPIQEVNFFTIVVAIQLQVGGNISEALSNLSNVLRDRNKLRMKVQAVSQEAKVSAAIIGALPPLVALSVWFSNPKYIEILFTHPTGHLIIAFGVISMTVGALVMRWMINIKV